MINIFMSLKDVEHVKHNLPLQEDIQLHKKGWTIQRIGWLLMFFFVILAAAGLFGDGILSKQKISTQQTFVEFDQFYRHEARMELKMDFQSGGEESVVSFPVHYLKKMKIEAIVPEPKENNTASGFIHYTFNGSDRMNVTFYIIPQTFGFIKGTMMINNNNFNLTHFIYP
jgi:hypothetical protein